MLFLLHAEDIEASRPELTRHPVLFETVDACEAEAARVLAQGKADANGLSHTYCIAIPDRQEFEMLFQEMDSRRDARREVKP